MWISCWIIFLKNMKKILINYGKGKLNLRQLHWWCTLKEGDNKSCSGAKPSPVSVKIYQIPFLSQLTLLWDSALEPVTELFNIWFFCFSKQESMQGMILNQRAKVCIFWISNMSLLSLVSVMHLHYYESILFCFSRDYCCLHAVIYLHCCRYIYIHIL